MNTSEIMAALIAERGRQRAKWSADHAWGRGDCSSPDVPMIVKAAVLAEEAGEVVRAVLTAGPARAVSCRDVRAEVVQTLAVAWAILEAM